jgi:hypothetical protein
VVKNVLVIRSGTEIALEIHEALCRRRELQLFGAEPTHNSHAAFVFVRNGSVPWCGDDEFLEGVNALLKQHSIDWGAQAREWPAQTDSQTPAGRFDRLFIGKPAATGNRTTKMDDV